LERAVTAEVTEIATRKVIASPVNCSESVVRTLERLLEEARAGHFQGIAYATIGEGADLRTGWSELPNWLEVLAGVTVLQKRLMETC
jgi:hypothetical protein